MPIIVANPLKRTYVYRNYGAYVNGHYFLLEIKRIETSYEEVVSSKGRIRSFLSGIYNEKSELVSQPNMNCVLDVMQVEQSSSDKKYHFVDMTSLARRLSIAEGYVVEILAINFVLEDKERPIFPSETKIDCSTKEVRAQIEKKMGTLKEIGEAFELVGFLHEIGLPNIATELAEGHVKFDKGDYDGCIKSYRKVVEGFRNYIQTKTIDKSKGRTEKIRRYIKASYSLLSNFGEHYGTKAFVEEGVFARDLVIALSRYMAKKLRKTA